METFVTLAYTIVPYSEPIFRIYYIQKVCQTCKMVTHIQSPGIVRTGLLNFQGYSGIFRDIDTYSATLTGMQLGRGGGLPCSFLKIEKSDFD